MVWCINRYITYAAMQVTKLPILQQSKYNRYSFLENVNSFPVDIPRLIFVKLHILYLEKKNQLTRGIFMIILSPTQSILRLTVYVLYFRNGGGDEKRSLAQRIRQ